MDVITSVLVTGSAILVSMLLAGEWLFYLYHREADKGLFYGKLNGRYVWLTKSEILKFFFSDNSE